MRAHQSGRCRRRGPLGAAASGARVAPRRLPAHGVVQELRLSVGLAFRTRRGAERVRLALLHIAGAGESRVLLRRLQITRPTLDLFGVEPRRDTQWPRCGAGHQSVGRAGARMGGRRTGGRAGRAGGEDERAGGRAVGPGGRSVGRAGGREAGGGRGAGRAGRKGYQLGGNKAGGSAPGTPGSRSGGLPGRPKPGAAVVHSFSLRSARSRLYFRAVLGRSSPDPGCAASKMFGQFRGTWCSLTASASPGRPEV